MISEHLLSRNARGPFSNNPFNSCLITIWFSIIVWKWSKRCGMYSLLLCRRSVCVCKNNWKPVCVFYQFLYIQETTSFGQIRKKVHRWFFFFFFGRFLLNAKRPTFFTLHFQNLWLSECFLFCFFTCTYLFSCQKYQWSVKLIQYTLYIYNRTLNTFLSCSSDWDILVGWFPAEKWQAILQTSILCKLASGQMSKHSRFRAASL